MSDLGQLMQDLAVTMPLWRDTAIVTLASIVVGAFYLYTILLAES